MDLDTVQVMVRVVAVGVVTWRLFTWLGGGGVVGGAVVGAAVVMVEAGKKLFETLHGVTYSIGVTSIKNASLNPSA